MPPNPNPGRSVGSAIFSAIAKIFIVLLIIGSVVALIFYGGVSPDQHGLKNLKNDKGLIGAWLGEWPTDENKAVQKFEQQSGVELDLVDVFLDWYTPARNVTHTVRHIADEGAIAMLTWEPHGITTPEIVEGKRELPMRGGPRLTIDRYIDEFAKEICVVQRETAQPVMMRIMHEMNGNWYSWGVTYEKDDKMPNSDDSYRQAWRKIHDAFERHCNQTLFVWAVNHFNVGQGATFTGTYPGDAYVDFIGIDGYNWGDNAAWGWQTFDTLFSEVYCHLRAEIPQKKIIVAETASTETGGDKGAWLNDMFSKIAYKDYPAVVGFVYFNFAKFEVEIGGNMDWPISSSSEALNAYRRGGELLDKMRAGDDLPKRGVDEFGDPVSSGPKC